jgi:4-amino-4-deoxy-L-arabinose transferase-like glycosyltransferase
MIKEAFSNLSERIIPTTGKGVFRLSFVLCFSVCFFIILVIAPLTGVSKYFGAGHDGYIQLAENLGRGNGYVFEKGGPPAFHRPPFYPLLLVPVTFLPTALQRPALVLIQGIMVGFIAALIFRIAKHFFGLLTAQAAVLIFLLNPWVYWNAKNPMTVILQGLLYTLFAVLTGREILIAIGRYNVPANKFNRFFIGITCAALALTHATMLAVTTASLLILLIVAVTSRNNQLIKTSITAAITMIILIAPWTYRNWVVFHRFIPIAGGGGLAYFNGNVHWKGVMPQHKGESYIDAGLRAAGIEGTEESHTHWKGLKDIRLEDKVNAKIMEDLRQYPGAFVRKLLLNAVEYYFPMFTYPYLAVKHLSVENFAITIFNAVLWILAFMGIRRCKKDKALLPAGLMVAAIGLYAIWFFPFATFIGHSLYTFATMPFLSMLAAKGLTSTGNS